MSKGNSTGSPQHAARMHSVPSHRSRTSQSPPATGPATKPSPGTTIQPVQGYKAQKDGKIAVLRRIDLGQGVVPVLSRASCHEHRLDLPAAKDCDDGDQRFNAPRRRIIKPPLQLPMNVTPRDWRSRSL